MDLSGISKYLRHDSFNKGSCLFFAFFLFFRGLYTFRIDKKPLKHNYVI